MGSENLSNFYTNHEFIYTSTSDTATVDSFYFKTQNSLVSEPAKVSITITPVFDYPTVDAQTVEAIEQTPKTITLTGRDPEFDNFVYLLSSYPSNGIISNNGVEIKSDETPKSLVGNEIIYTSNSDTATEDSFEARIITDAGIYSETANIDVTISPVNDAPTAINDTISVTEKVEKSFKLNASDPDSNLFDFIITSLPSSGTLKDYDLVLTEDYLPYTISINKPYSEEIIYLSNSETATNDSFTFKAKDRSGDENTNLSENGTIKFNITLVNEKVILQ
ncbi:hypothetical protein EB155_09350 [archaeon]|nr:hypothetical protein [archaeon]